MKAGAEGLEQGGLFDVHGGWNEVSVSDRCYGEFGERARERRWRRAKVETSSATGTASSAMAERIERDAIADLEICDARADLDDFTCRFVAENHGEPRDHSLCARAPTA